MSDLRIKITFLNLYTHPKETMTIFLENSVSKFSIKFIFQISLLSSEKIYKVMNKINEKGV